MSLDLSSLTTHVFPDASEADWRDAVAKVLKGGSFEKLRTPTPDGIIIEPIYARAPDAVAVASPRGAAPWDVMQRIDHPVASEANALALADLGGGASALDLVFATSPHARGFGITGTTPADIAKLLDGVMADLIAIRIDAGDASPLLAHTITDWAKSGAIAPDALALDLTFDPIGMAARNGGAAISLAARVVEAGLEAAASPARTVFAADGRIWHEAGASRVETLAAVLATAVAYWRALEAAGLSIEAAAGRIGFILAIDQGQFSGIAEIRALRLLWARATSAVGLEPQPARIHAETAWRMMSRLDANTNMIRTTIAGFAAGVGGADSVTVLPFSAANGLPDAFARRLARNAQLVLLEEANLFRVSDPAAGSGRVEAETRELAEATWSLFREIEAGGGIVASLISGNLQTRITATAAARARDIARRKDALTGASEFPLLAEPPVAVLDVAPVVRSRAAIVEAFPALASHRLSEPFEHLRDTAVAAAPKVFLANLGGIADFNLRSAWVKNLFEAGGIAALGNDGFATLDEMTAAFRASGARAVCIASSDAVYADHALPALAALRSAGAGPVFFAGKPAEPLSEAALRTAGVDVFLFAGQDMITVLTDAQARIAKA